MPRPYKCDYEIGYRYAREQVVAGIGSCRWEYFIDLARAFLLEQSSSAELSRGMGSYYLQIGVTLLLVEVGYKTDVLRM